LAVADAIDKARHFVLIIAVDHKPLLGLFTSSRSLDNIPNNRLRNLKERTLRYCFTMLHVPGLKNRALDALSHHSTGDPKLTQLILPDDIFYVALLHLLRSTTWGKVLLVTTSDDEMKTLIDVIESRLPDFRENLQLNLQIYHREQLSMTDGVAMYEDRIMIPPSLCPRILSIFPQRYIP